MPEDLEKLNRFYQIIERYYYRDDYHNAYTDLLSLLTKNRDLRRYLLESTNNLGHSPLMIAFERTVHLNSIFLMVLAYSDTKDLAYISKNNKSLFDLLRTDYYNQNTASYLDALCTTTEFREHALIENAEEFSPICAHAAMYLSEVSNAVLNQIVINHYSFTKYILMYALYTANFALAKKLVTLLLKHNKISIKGLISLVAMLRQEATDNNKEAKLNARIYANALKFFSDEKNADLQISNELYEYIQEEYANPDAGHSRIEALTEMLNMLYGDTNNEDPLVSENFEDALYKVYDFTQDPELFLDKSLKSKHYINYKNMLDFWIKHPKNAEFKDFAPKALQFLEKYPLEDEDDKDRLLKIFNFLLSNPEIDVDKKLSKITLVKYLQIPNVELSHDIYLYIFYNPDLLKMLPDTIKSSQGLKIFWHIYKMPDLDPEQKTLFFNSELQERYIAEDMFIKLNTEEKDDLLLFDSRKDLWNALKENFGAYLAIYPWSQLAAILDKLHIPEDPIKYTHIIGKIPNKKNQQKIDLAKIINDLAAKELLQKSTEYIAEQDNPIILAALHSDVDIIKQAYLQRKESPWQEYWQKAGNKNNTLLRFLLLPEKTKIERSFSREILNFVFDQPNIVSNVDQNFLAEMRSHASQAWRSYELNQNLQEFFSKVNKSSLLDRMWRKASINTLWETAIATQQANQNAQSKLIVSNSDSHNYAGVAEVFMHIKKHEDYFYEANYPGQDHSKIKKVIASDTRLILLKNYIELEPIAATPAHAEWQKIIKALDAEEYYKKYKEQGSICAWQAFKTFAEKNAAINKALKNENAEFNKIVDMDNKNCDVQIRYSWDVAAYSLAADVRRVSNFATMLITEDVTTLVQTTDDPEKLYDLLRGSLAPNTDKIRKELAEILIHKKPTDLSALKQATTRCLLQHQASMAANLQSTFWEIKNDSSCDPGKKGRLVCNVISQHRLFVRDEMRDVKIQTYLNESLKRYSEEMVVKILLRRLRQKTFSRKGNVKHALTFGAYGYHDINQSIDAGIRKEITKLLKTPITNLSALQDRLQKMDPKSRVFIWNTILNIDNTKTFDLAKDKELARLFDALFTVNADNFINLFTGECKLPKYTSLHVKKAGGDLTETDYMHRKEVDTVYHRNHFIYACYNIKKLFSNIKNYLLGIEPVSPSLNEYERKLAKLSCIAGPSKVISNGIAADLLAKIKDLTTGPVDEFITALNAAKNDTITPPQIKVKKLSDRLSALICSELFKLQAAAAVNKEEYNRNDVEDKIDTELGNFTLQELSKDLCKWLLADFKCDFKYRSSMHDFIFEMSKALPPTQDNSVHPLVRMFASKP